MPVELDALVDGHVGAVFDRFHELHLRSYGFSSPADECEVVTMRLVATIGIDKPSLAHVPEDVGTRCHERPDPSSCPTRALSRR